MRVQLFTIPIYDGEDYLNELNKFLSSHRVTDVQKSFVDGDNGGSWSFCISYLETAKVTSTEPKKGKVDYRNILDEKDFAIFCELRKVRKQISESESIPPFAVFTDAELAEIAKLNEITLATMKQIPGVGERKVEKYGASFMAVTHEKGGESDESDC